MEVKERKDINPQDMWDLSTLFENDEEFEKALKQADSLINEVKAYQGTLHEAGNILACLKKECEVSRKIANLYSYGFLRKTEDTRNTKAQTMFSAAYAKMVALQTATSYIQPEILANDEETADRIIHDPSLSEFAFMLENMFA